jgi:Plasmid pRiA4b ORF-3-like protein.
VGLQRGSKLAYLFDFGDEWRLALEVVDSWQAEDGVYPMLVEAAGTPPPQYPPLDEDG